MEIIGFIIWAIIIMTWGMGFWWIPLIGGFTLIYIIFELFGINDWIKKFWKKHGF